MIRGLSAIFMPGIVALEMVSVTIPDNGGNSVGNSVEISVLEQIIAAEDSCVHDSRKTQMDSVRTNDEKTRYTGLSEADFNLVAEELGIEVAVIKAVVAVEAGKEMKGFWAPGIPVINFDRTMYARFKSKAVSKAGAKGEKVPSGLKGYALKEWRQLVNARRVNEQGANMGTFWGMFQIGGFNYRKCGCETIEEFVSRMSCSELDQLELFAAFIKNGGMLDALKSKNWSAFARKYNGPGYAKRGYHKKMASAYKKFKEEADK